jgi:hypothetical protein
VAGPLSNAVLPQIRAGGALGHDPLGTDPVAVAVGELLLVVGDGAAVVVLGEGAAVVGAAELGVGEGAVVVEGLGAALVVVVVGFGLGAVLGLATWKVAVRTAELRPDRRTAVMLCDPLVSFAVSYGFARRSAAVPAKSNGAVVSTRIGGRVRPGSSR